MTLPDKKVSIDDLQMTTKVSVLLSCYKADSLIESYVDYWLHTDFGILIELVVIDFPFSHKNASQVFQNIEKLRAKYDVQYIEESKNLCLYEAWNTGLAMAKSEFISNLNLDDRVDAQYYNSAIASLNDFEADIFSSAAIMTSEIGEVSSDARQQNHLGTDENKLTEYGLSDLISFREGHPLKRCIPHCAPVWRKSLHSANGLFDINYDFSADYEFWLRCASNGSKFLYLNKPFTIFYCATGTASDRILHSNNIPKLDYWSQSFPLPNYKPTHLGTNHDKLHFSANRNVIFSNRKYFATQENLVSIVVVAHSKPTLLIDLISSICCQVYELFECIIIIDGSPFADAIESKVQETCLYDKRFNYVKLSSKYERNYARNIGIQLAQGKWITICDEDDVLPTTSISDRVNFAVNKSSSSDIVFGNIATFTDLKSNSLSDLLFRNFYNFNSLRTGWPHHCSVLFPSALLKQIGYPANSQDLFSRSSQIAGEDAETMMSIIEHSKIQYINCNKTVYLYRRHASSSYVNRWESILVVINRILNRYGSPDKADSEYMKALVSRVASLLLWYGYSLNIGSVTLNKNKLNILLLSHLDEQLEEAHALNTIYNLENSINQFYKDLNDIFPDSGQGSLNEKLIIQLKQISTNYSNSLTLNHVCNLLANLITIKSGATLTNKTDGEAKIQSKSTSSVTQSVDTRYDTSRVSKFKNIHNGKTAILICNGPSLNKVDFDDFGPREEFIVFGLNKIHLGFDRIGLIPDYVVAVNSKVIEQTEDHFSKSTVTKFLSNRYTGSTITENDSTYFINTINPPEKPTRFSRDSSKYVNEGWTVTHAALQIAYYMGIKNIIIVGMDHSFKQHIVGQENKEAVIEGDDIDHFIPSYFGHGQQWDLPDLNNSEISYMKAREEYSALGRTIFDGTIGGKCTIFTKIPISNLHNLRYHNEYRFIAIDHNSIEQSGVLEESLGRRCNFNINTSSNPQRESNEAAGTRLGRAIIPLALPFDISNSSFTFVLTLTSTVACSLELSLARYRYTPYEGVHSKVELEPGVPSVIKLSRIFKFLHSEYKIQIDLLNIASHDSTPGSPKLSIIQMYAYTTDPIKSSDTRQLIPIITSESSINSIVLRMKP